MLIDAAWDYALEHASPLTRKLMEDFESNPEIKRAIGEKKVTINTRVHMMMKGQYPDLPFWRKGHPFSEGDDSGAKIFYLTSLASTQNPLHSVEFLLPQPEDLFLGLSGLKFSREGQTEIIHPNDKVRFSNQIPYRSREALSSGWKLTFWITLGKAEVTNQIVKQTRMYLEDPSLGW